MNEEYPGRPYGDRSPTESDVFGEKIRLEGGYSLGVRLDFSEHQGSEPHLNQDILDIRGHPQQSAEILGNEAHRINLW